MEELKESYQERLENTFDMYKDAIKEHAYQCAMNRVEDDYVPVEEFIAEQENAEALRCEVSELKSLVSTARRAPVLDQSCQTHSSTDTAGDDRWKWLYKEKCAIEKMCEDKQQLILALEQRLLDLNETHHTLKDDFRQKCADLEALQRKAEDQTNSIYDLLRENADKDNEIASLKAECCKLSQKSSVPPKTKRGLLSNIRESVTSPGKSTIGQTLRKTVRATPSKHKLST